MKRLLFLLFAFCLFSFSFAQSSFVKEGVRDLNGMEKYSFMFELPDVDQKMAEDAWKELISDYKTKAKFSKKKDYWLADDAKITKISENTIDIYANIIEGKKSGKSSTFIVWFDLGGAFLNPEAHPVQTRAGRDILTKFIFETSKEQAEEIVKTEEKKLKDMESALNKLEKQEKDYTSEIEKAQQQIKKMEKAIKENQTEQQKLKAELEKQGAKAKAANMRVRKL